MQAPASESAWQSELTPRQRGDARQAAYRLFAEFFDAGPEPEHMRLLEELGLAPEDVSLDADEVASKHFSLLGLDVLPYASWFLEADGMLGGPSTEKAASLRRRVFGNLHVRDAPDHISAELEIVAALTTPESEGENDLVEFLDEHLLWWLPAFAFALGRTGGGLYSRAADVLLELVARHRQDLVSTRSNGRVLPAPVDILQDDRAGVRELAHYLATPALSGVVLVRSRIVEAGRTLGLPRGFGDRRLMIGNLLRSAAEYDAVENLATLLLKEVELWTGLYSDLSAQWPTVFAEIGEEWIIRLDETASMLERLSAALVNGDEEN